VDLPPPRTMAPGGPQEAHSRRFVRRPAPPVQPPCDPQIEASPDQHMVEQTDQAQHSAGIPGEVNWRGIPSSERLSSAADGAVAHLPEYRGPILLSRHPLDPEF
jgi:hypothetical protein